MSDLHSINEAINAKAGRKLLPSILVGLSLIALVWLTLAYARVFFAVLVAIAVALGIREIARAFAAAGTQISMRSLVLATVGLTYATWSAGVEGLAIATAIALPVLLIFRYAASPVLDKYVVLTTPVVSLDISKGVAYDILLISFKFPCNVLLLPSVSISISVIIGRETLLLVSPST